MMSLLIKNIQFFSNKISLGDLFVYTQLEDLQKAVEKGAYAILFDKEIQITDHEIAWIRVKSLKTALIRILRLYLREKSIHIYYINEIKTEIIKSIIPSKQLIILEDTIFDTFQKIFNAKENSLIICSDEDMLKKIYPDYKMLGISQKQQIQVINYSIFETTFLYKNRFFKNIKLPKIFIEELEAVLSFESLSLFLLSKLILNKYKVAYLSTGYKRYSWVHDGPANFKNSIF